MGTPFLPVAATSRQGDGARLLRRFFSIRAPTRHDKKYQPKARWPADFSAFALCFVDYDLIPRTRAHQQALVNSQLKMWNAVLSNDIPPT
jgi:hypothetical protein